MMNVRVAIGWWLVFLGGGCALSGGVTRTGPEAPFVSPAAGEGAGELLSGYLRIDTRNPPGDVRAAADFLEARLRGGALLAAGLEIRRIETDPGRAVNLAARLPATVPGGGGSIVLLHHMDVVGPGDGWSRDPFAGEVADGAVWGRGALDDKGMGIAQLLALEHLVRSGVPRARDVWYLAVADEEVGSAHGAAVVVETLWEDLQPAVVLDEGGFGVPDPFGGGRPVYACAVAEKGILWLRLRTQGMGGHGSMPGEGDAPIRLAQALARLADEPPPPRFTPTTFRLLEGLAPLAHGPGGFLLSHARVPLVRGLVLRRVARDPGLGMMFRDTIAITGLRAGVGEPPRPNVIPPQAEALLDCRLLPGTDPDVFRTRIGRMAGRDVEVTTLLEPDEGRPSPIEAPWWTALEIAILAEVPDAVFLPILSPAASDARFFRARGVPAYGLVPFLLPPGGRERIHGRDERIEIEELERGVRIIARFLAGVVGT